MPDDTDPSDQAPAPQAPRSSALEVRGLVKRYRGTEALRGLDLDAPSGAVTALLGPNGAGKTTTVEICEGLRHADAGSVRVLGADPATRDVATRARVGVMLQDGGLPSTAPAGLVLRHVAAMYASPRRPDELVERLGLAGCLRTPVRRLSGGQRQRVALAAAVVGRPDLVFLDEPSAGLDPQSRLAVWELVRELRADGTTIVLTTHQMAEAESLADHVVVVDHGRAITHGTVDELVGVAGTVRVTLRDAAPRLGPGPAPDRRDGLGAALAAAGRPVRVTTSGTDGALEVHGEPDPELVHAITAWARSEGLLVTALTTGRRTLEDVFLDLTGRNLR